MLKSSFIFRIILSSNTFLYRYRKPGRSIIVGQVLWTEGAKTKIPAIDSTMGVMYNLLLDKKASLNPNVTNVHYQDFTSRGNHVYTHSQHYGIKC